MKKDKDYKFLIQIDSELKNDLIFNNLLICDTKSQARQLIKDFYKFLDNVKEKCPKYSSDINNRFIIQEDTKIFNEKEKFLKNIVWPMNIDFSIFFDACNNNTYYKNILSFIKIPYLANEK